MRSTCPIIQALSNRGATVGLGSSTHNEPSTAILGPRQRRGPTAHACAVGCERGVPTAHACAVGCERGVPTAHACAVGVRAERPSTDSRTHSPHAILEIERTFKLV